MKNNFNPIVGYKCQFRNDEIDLIVNSEVLVVDKPYELSYTWVGGPNTIVTWTLIQKGETTHLHLEQTGFDKEGQAFIGAKYGWAYKIENLARFIM